MDVYTWYIYIYTPWYIYIYMKSSCSWYMDVYLYVYEGYGSGGGLRPLRTPPGPIKNGDRGGCAPPTRPLDLSQMRIGGGGCAPPQPPGPITNADRGGL